MSTIVMNKKDELIMKLVHYFITEENYNPIVVNGVKDEIWLENADGPYRIIRINSNNIFNTEQLKYDYLKIESIVKQIKKKTFSFHVNTLNILLNVNEDLKLEDEKDVTLAPIFNNNTNITNESILEAFPNINEKLLNDEAGVELIINVTKDINEKTEKENKKFEKTFKAKKIVMTPFIMALCVAMFIVCLWMDGIGALNGVSGETMLLLGGSYKPLIADYYQVWRLVSAIFLHWSLLHLVVNMYSLFILGTQVETFMGKVKFLVIYLISGICGCLLSCVVGDNVLSAGASGAIFGLMGCLLYFGYYYRNYLGSSLLTQILPIIAINLIIGFLPGSNIDNFAHIGGLVGGFFATMAVGVPNKGKKSERINGIICLTIYTIFAVYFIFFR